VLDAESGSCEMILRKNRRRRAEALDSNPSALSKCNGKFRSFEVSILPLEGVPGVKLQPAKSFGGQPDLVSGSCA